MTSNPPPPPKLFVAGTDTGVGKTAVACGLLRLARRRNLRFVPYKPAESGVSDTQTTDAARLLDACGLTDLSVDDVCPNTFGPPISPAAAAEMRGTALSLELLMTRARRLRSLGDALLIEAAGGLLCPYGPTWTGVDLAVALEAPVLLVARNALGTVNHTLLSLAELARRRHPIAGVVLVSTHPEPAPDQPSNAVWIERLGGIRPLAVLPHLPNGDDAAAHTDRLADAIEASPGLSALVAAA